MEKMKKLFMVIFCAFVLTGCYKVNLDIKVDKNLKASGDMEILMKEELGSQEDLSKSADSDMKGFKIIDKNVKKTIDGDEYVGVKLQSKDITDSLDCEIEEKDEKVTFKLNMNSSDSELPTDQFGGEDTDMSSLKAMDVEFNVTIKMPGKIKKANGGKISGSSVTYDLLDFDKEEIVITSEKSSDSLSILIFGGVIIAIGAVGLVLWKMRKSKQTEENTQQVNSFEPTTSNEIVVDEKPVTSEEANKVETNTTDTKENQE